jgi:hypothetical protein
MDEGLIFTQIPAVMIASNFFNCQIPIRYKDEAMVEFVNELSVYRTKIPIYHPDGTKLAVVKGSEIYPTEAGKKAGVELHNEAGLTVCELNKKPVFEIQKQGANALKMQAELHTFDGFFLKWSKEIFSGQMGDGAMKIRAAENALIIGGGCISRNSFKGTVGIQIGQPENRLPACILVPIISSSEEESLKKKLA